MRDKNKDMVNLALLPLGNFRWSDLGGGGQNLVSLCQTFVFKFQSEVGSLKCFVMGYLPMDIFLDDNCVTADFEEGFKELGQKQSNKIQVCKKGCGQPISESYS